MAESSEDRLESLLARLSGRGAADEVDATCVAVEAVPPKHDTPAAKAASEAGENDSKLDGLLDRINQIAARDPELDATPALSVPAPVPPPPPPKTPTNHSPTSDTNTFVPLAPKSFREAELSESQVEALVLKYLLCGGDSPGRSVADQLRLPFLLIDQLMHGLKSEQLVVHRSAAAMNDFVYQLTDVGRERAKRYSEQCTYFGAAPVSLEDYIASVEAQSLDKQHPSVDDLKHAFSDLLINSRTLNRLGPAINSGRGMFLYGYPGNGKTSIAERVTQAFGKHIWIPRALGVDGEIMRLYDPNHHEACPIEDSEGLLDNRKVDRRWVRVRRPTIIVGGELTMANLEIAMNTSTGISEAPLQLKANCGTLLIDDFGRQKMGVDELLNRWIVPLEKRYDFLNMANGKKIQVPFDELIVFATNLEPKDLVDEAFLRRIPYKIEVIDPTEDEFRQLFQLMCPKLGFEYEDNVINRVIDRHFKSIGRPMRCCQPRDLLMQISNFCNYQKRPLELTDEYFDFAAENYFAVM